MPEEQTMTKVQAETEAQKAADIAAEVIADEIATTANQPQDQLGLNDLDCGYVVGVKDGNFVFELVGKDKKDLLKLLGIHKFAVLRVRQTFDQTQMTGDSLVHEVGKALQVINQKIDMLVQAQKKPDTQL